MILEIRCQKCQANLHFTQFIEESACARLPGVHGSFKLLSGGGAVENSHNNSKKETTSSKKSIQNRVKENQLNIYYNEDNELIWIPESLNRNNQKAAWLKCMA